MEYFDLVSNDIKDYIFIFLNDIRDISNFNQFLGNEYLNIRSKNILQKMLPSKIFDSISYLKRENEKIMEYSWPQIYLDFITNDYSNIIRLINKEDIGTIRSKDNINYIYTSNFNLIDLFYKLKINLRFPNSIKNIEILEKSIDKNINVSMSLYDFLSNLSSYHLTYVSTGLYKTAELFEQQHKLLIPLYNYYILNKLDSINDEYINILIDYYIYNNQQAGIPFFSILKAREINLNIAVFIYLIINNKKLNDDRKSKFLISLDNDINKNFDLLKDSSNKYLDFLECTFLLEISQHIKDI